MTSVEPGEGVGVKSVLVALDFPEASREPLRLALAIARHYGAEFHLVHVLPITPIPESFHWSSTTGGVMQMRDKARLDILMRLEELALRNPPLTVKPEFMVKFGEPSEQMVQAARAPKADVIIMDLNRSTHIHTASHIPWTTAYEVACAAGCPVLTMRR